MKAQQAAVRRRLQAGRCCAIDYVAAVPSLPTSRSSNTLTRWPLSSGEAAEEPLELLVRVSQVSTTYTGCAGRKEGQLTL